MNFLKKTCGRKSAAASLVELLTSDTILKMPCCYDALSARLIERAGFPLTFMSGFSVAAARLALPDAGLISYAEMLDQGRSICEAVSIPVIGDADTGYGNAINVKRTVQGYSRAGFACLMIEDQVSPKRCGHTKGKKVVDRGEALGRIRAAVDARQEGADILIMARTDARATHGLDEALWRCQAFADLGADIIFMEAPGSVDEMRRFCSEVKAATMANMLPQGVTPILPPERLQDLGFKIVAYPLSLLSASIVAMQSCLGSISKGALPEDLDFEDLKDLVGFPDYYAEEEKYREQDENREGDVIDNG